MVPVTHWSSALTAVTTNMLNTGVGTIDNVLTKQGAFEVVVLPNPRLTWTTKFAMFRTDGDVKPFIAQEEEGVTTKVLGPGSDEEFWNDRHVYGLKAIRNVGYGYWQHAVLTTFS